MQRKYAGDGLAAVSVSLDKAGDSQKIDADTVERVRKFLAAHDADFTNQILDEPDDVWSEKFHSDLTPFVFVFDRDGRLAARFEGKDANYRDKVEPKVIELLKK